MSSASDFIIENGVLKKYVGPGGDVVIPEGVTSISGQFAGAFQQCANMTSVVIPEGTTSIGWRTFLYCSSLKSIVIPKSVTQIESEAFSYCNSLTSVTIPGSVTRLEYETFSNCSSLMEAVIMDGLKTICTKAFYKCSSLKSIYIPESVENIEPNAFHLCSRLTAFEVDEKNKTYCASEGLLLTANRETLVACPPGLTSVSIPKGVKNIGKYAFSSCGLLSDVVIPDGVTSIEECAFENCRGIVKIQIPDSLESIGKRVFDGCTCDVSIRHWSEQFSEAVGNNQRIRIHTKDKLSEIPIKYRTQALLGFVSETNSYDGSERAKTYVEYLKKNAVRRKDFAFEYPELLAFLCEHLLIPAKDVEAFLSEARSRSDAEKTALLLDYQNRLGTEKISKAREKKEKSKEKVFDAFVERSAKRSPEMGIEGMAFAITGKLLYWSSRKELQTYLESYDARLDSSVTKKTDYLVSNEAEDSEKSRKAKDYGVQVIREADFNEMIGRRFRDSPTITIPLWLKTIPDEAFHSCMGLIEATIPAGVTKIGKSAFNNCKNLTKVTVPEGVMSIGVAAFMGCDSLESISLPKSVTQFGMWAFSNCPKLSIHAPAGSYAEQYAKKHNIPFVAE